MKAAKRHRRLWIGMLIFGLVIQLLPMQQPEVKAADAVDWQSVGGGVVEAGLTSDLVSIAIDSSGIPYVAFRASTNRIMVKKYDETTRQWEPVGNGDISAGAGGYMKLAIDNRGNPYVVYVDSVNNSKVTVKKYDETTDQWEPVGSNGVVSAGMAAYSSIAIDSNGTPYVAYEDTNNGNAATVKTYDETTDQWEPVGSNGVVSTGWSPYTSIAIDSNDTPYVVYRDGYNATVKKYNGTTRQWEIVGNAGFSAGNIENTSIAIDSSGTPYVAYVDLKNNNKATVMKYNGVSKSWINVGMQGFSVGEVDYVSIAIYGNGTPYVLYKDEGKATVKKYNETTSQWDTVGSAGFLASSAYNSSIAIDNRGTPYFVYTNDQKAIVMSYPVTLSNTASAAIAAPTPVVGVDDTVTLAVKNSLGDTDTTFSGAHEVTISGYAQAPDGSYGSFNGTALTEGPNTISVTFADGVATPKLQLNKATSQTIGFSVADVATPATNTVSLAPAAGIAASMEIATDAAAPAANGGAFAQQPVVKLLDAYGNVSTGDNGTVVTASKQDAGEWTLTGTTTATASAGVVTFMGLGVTNVDEVTGAQLAFDATGLATITGAAVTLLPPVPAAPSVDSITAGDSHVRLTWSEVRGAVSYAVYRRTASDSYEDAIATVSGSVYDAVGLTNGTPYYFVVKAMNPSGVSAASNEVSATPQVLAPGATVLEPAVPGDTQVSLIWHPVAYSTGYKIFVSTTPGAYGPEAATVSGSVYSYEATGLTNGITYHFVVTSTNPGGDSAASNQVSATPRAVPAAPTDVTATAGNGQATVSFTAPANGGSAITNYEVTASPGNRSVTGASSPITVTGLSNGVAYTFTVKAINGAGSSAASAASNEVTPSAPYSGGGTWTPTPSATPDPEPAPTEPVPTEPEVNPYNVGIINVDELVKRFEDAVAEAKRANLNADLAEIQGHWAEKTIHLFVKLHFIKGYEDGKFRVDGTITRAEFAELLNRVFDFQSGSGTTSAALSDIGNHWANSAIKMLADAGIITGYKDGTFKPDHTITREEMVMMLSRIINLTDVRKDATKGNFIDLKGSYAAEEIKAGAQAGVINGKGNGKFDPGGKATRAEALQIILNVLEMNPQLKALLDSLK